MINNINNIVKRIQLVSIIILLEIDREKEFIFEHRFNVEQNKSF